MRIISPFLLGVGLLATPYLTEAVVSATMVPLPVVSGWRPSGDPRTFSPDTLYEHINGASELYLSYAFRRLVVAELEDGRGATVVVELYEHATPADAFGIYSQERPSRGHYIAVGAEAYLEPPILNLLAGPFYVKLSAEGLGERSAAVLQAFATATVARLDGPHRLPDALALFPAEGRIARSERYAAKDFLGHGFLRSGFTTEYSLDGRRFQLFVIETASPGESEALLRQYRRRAGLADEAPPGVHTLEDPYNGPVTLAREGRLVCGGLGKPPDGHVEALRLAAARAR